MRIRYELLLKFIQLIEKEIDKNGDLPELLKEKSRIQSEIIFMLQMENEKLELKNIGLRYDLEDMKK